MLLYLKTMVYFKAIKSKRIFTDKLISKRFGIEFTYKEVKDADGNTTYETQYEKIKKK